MRNFFTTAVVLGTVSSVALGACTPTIKVEAPDKPIRLQVDINIKQEVLLKVENDVDTVSSAPAIPLAKKAGWIGERLDGYLGLVNAEAPGDIRELVLTANEEREQKYSLIAQKHNTKREVIETVAGRKFIAKSEAGEYVKNDAGDWIQK